VLTADNGIWRASFYKGYPSIIGDNGCIRIEIVPGRGSKAVSLLNLETGREWLFANDRAWEPLTYGMNWEDGDRSGWDEMFPTILPCSGADPAWQQAIFPDHGEVWTLPWESRLAANEAQLWVDGVQVPYRLSKTYRLTGKTVEIAYRLDNPTAHKFSYLWTPHALLHIHEGMKLVTESHQRTIEVPFTFGGRLKLDGVLSDYPRATAAGDSEETDLSTMSASGTIHAEKYWFTEPFNQGRAALTDPLTGEALTYCVNPDEVPYLAVWVNNGALWGEYNAAIEPATAYLDTIAAAGSAGKAKAVEGFSSATWSLKVTLSSNGED